MRTRIQLHLVLLLLLSACPEADPVEGASGRPVDQDGDGLPEDEDCNDLDPDQGLVGVWYLDADGDGSGNPSEGRQSCGAVLGYVLDSSDCDDSNLDVHPEATEYCDGLDNDCDDEVDEACEAEPLCGDDIASGTEECDGGDDEACPGVCSVLCSCPSGPSGLLRVRVIDVWQGDSILVISPDGFTMLVDAGPSGHEDDIRAALQAEGVEGLNYTVLSHNHADHYGSLADVLREHPEVDASYDHGQVDYDWGWQEYAELAGARRHKLMVGGRVDMGPAIDVEVLHAFTNASDENANSIVLRIRYNDVTALLGGDCNGECEYDTRPGPIDFYKVHHHGSYDASSDHILDQMQPDIAAISAGSGNSYGHPHDETLRRLNEHDCRIYRTDQDGDITFSSNGSNTYLETVY